MPIQTAVKASDMEWQVDVDQSSIALNKRKSVSEDAEDVSVEVREEDSADQDINHGPYEQPEGNLYLA